MRELLTATVDRNISLIPGDRGIFDIKHNGQLLYSKNTTGRFPNDEEIESMINSLSEHPLRP